MNGTASKKKTPFELAFDDIIAGHFWSKPDVGFMKAKRALYFESLGEFPIDVLNEAIAEARKESDGMPSVATLFALCKQGLEKRHGIKSAAEIQAELEREGERCKVEFIDAWQKLERFNRWEVSQIKTDAEERLREEGLFPHLGRSQMPCPGILIRQKMVQLAKERGVI